MNGKNLEKMKKCKALFNMPWKKKILQGTSKNPGFGYLISHYFSCRAFKRKIIKLEKSLPES